MVDSLDKKKVIQDIEKAKETADFIIVFRITSYNVCYTKLLRLRMKMIPAPRGFPADNAPLTAKARPASLGSLF